MSKVLTIAERTEALHSMLYRFENAAQFALAKHQTALALAIGTATPVDISKIDTMTDLRQLDNARAIWWTEFEALDASIKALHLCSAISLEQIQVHLKVLDHITAASAAMKALADAAEAQLHVQMEAVIEDVLKAL